MKRKQFILVFPGARGGIMQNPDTGFWGWWATYRDGSGYKSDWCPTKRGAMICAVSQARIFSNHYGKVKWHWEEVFE